MRFLLCCVLMFVLVMLLCICLSKSHVKVFDSCDGCKWVCDQDASAIHCEDSSGTHMAEVNCRNVKPPSNCSPFQKSLIEGISSGGHGSLCVPGSCQDPDGIMKCTKWSTGENRCGCPAEDGFEYNSDQGRCYQTNTCITYGGNKTAFNSPVCAPEIGGAPFQIHKGQTSDGWNYALCRTDTPTPTTSSLSIYPPNAYPLCERLDGTANFDKMGFNDDKFLCQPNLCETGICEPFNEGTNRCLDDTHQARFAPGCSSTKVTANVPDCYYCTKPMGGSCTPQVILGENIPTHKLYSNVQRTSIEGNEISKDVLELSEEMSFIS